MFYFIGDLYGFFFEYIKENWSLVILEINDRLGYVYEDYFCVFCCLVLY